MGLARFIGLSLKGTNGSSRDGARSVERAVSLCRNLLSEPGESGRFASDFWRAYSLFQAPERAQFFDRLGREFSPDPEEVGRCGDAYRKEPSAANLARLLRVVEPSRQELFRRLNTAPGGTRMLVEMRRQLLSENGQHPDWTAIEADLAHLLTSWFNRAFLVLRRIDWHTPPVILEKLIAYEAVHQIQGWGDLRRRLEADRRCYGFFHPALPDEPIIFIEVALVNEMSARVQPLLDPDSPVISPAAAHCAMFYSITNCQEGLRGVPFGNSLIHTVAGELGREFPRLRTYATVSPIPGFVEWLTAESRRQGGPSNATWSSLLGKLEAPRWCEDAQRSAELQRELTPLCAYYLLHVKQGEEPLDPVARFHLRNGARLDRINWLGDTSPVGLKRSAGMMANYVYRLRETQRNHERYTRQHRIPAAWQVERLAQESGLARVRAIR